MSWLSYSLYRLLSWVRYAASRRFTPAGWLAVAGAIVSGAIGIDMNRTVAFQAFALVVCLIAMAMIVAPFFRGRFSAERVLPRFGSVGQPFTYMINVRNRAAKQYRDLEVLEDLADPRPTYREYVDAQKTSAPGLFRRKRGTIAFGMRLAPSPPINNRQAITRPIPLPQLPAKGGAQVSMEIVPLRRGPLRFKGVSVARPDPFGLFRSFARVPLPQAVVILPKRYPLPPIELPGTRQYQRGGLSLAAAVGESEEFVSLRDYRPGDPLRHIHWRSWARLGRPIVKEFQDEFLVRHALVLDTFGGLECAAAFEEAISVAASFACTVNTQESLLDLMFVGAQAICFTTGRGMGQTEQALEILASVRATTDKPFEALKNLVMTHAVGLCGCICVLLRWDEQRRELVRKLEMNGMSVLVLVVADGQEAKRLREEAEERPEHFHILEVGDVAKGLQELEGVGAG